MKTNGVYWSERAPVEKRTPCACFLVIVAERRTSVCRAVLSHLATIRSIRKAMNIIPTELIVNATEKREERLI